MLPKLLSLLFFYSNYDRAMISEVKIEGTLRNGRSLKTTKRRLSTGRHRLFVLKAANGNVKTNVEELVQVAEKF